MTDAVRGSRRRDAAETRVRLLAAARELFTTVGFRATTTPMLAERAGIAEGTIYRHFAGKDALLNAAYREVQVRATALIPDADPLRPARAADRLHAIGRGILETAARDPAEARVLLHMRELQALDEVSREAARAWRDALTSVVASGKSDGVVRAGPAELWAGVWLAVIAFAADRVAAGEWGADHHQATLALGAAWDAIAAPAATGGPGST